MASFAPLRSLLDSSLQSGGWVIGSEPLVAARGYSNELGLGLLGILSARYIYRLIKQSAIFPQLNGPTPDSSLWGDEELMFSPETSLKIHNELLNKYGSVCKIKGMLGEDRLWVADPRAMHDIVLKSHESFHEHEAFLSWVRLSSGSHLLVTTGHKHKMQRKILNPVFTAKHMRNLTSTFTSIAHHLESIVARTARANGSNTGIVDIYTLMSNTALEMIGQAGMGHSFGILDNKVCEYLEASHKLNPLMNSLWYVRPFLSTLMKVGPSSFRRAVVDRIPFGKVQELKNVIDIMDNTASYFESVYKDPKQAIDIYRQKKLALANGTLDSEIAAGQDIISMLLKQNEVVPPEEQMTEDEIIAHVNGLIFAGHDTTSGALGRTFYLLAQHPDVQDRVRQEVQEAHRLYGKDLDYDQLNSLTYLDAICRESLRLWSPAQLVERVAAVDYNLPLQYPVKSKDGKTTISNLQVPKGTHIYVSLGGVNRDKDTWGEDADSFNPDRWLKPMPASVSEANIPGVYSNMMTFLGGPRACLGFKFSQLEMKIVFSLLISSFKFELSNEDIEWTSIGIVKPVVRRKDGKLDLEPSMPMKVTVLE